MRKLLHQIDSFRCLALISCGCLLSAAIHPPAPLTSAGTPAVAWSSGVLRIDGSDHSGSGNLLPGAQLDTLRSAGQLYLADGSRLRLAASTRLSVQTQDLRLDSGAARIDSSRTVNVAAGELRIAASGGSIERPAANRVVVTAGSTTTQVRRSDGLLLAKVLPGQSLTFSLPQNGSTSSTSLTGRVTSRGNQLALTDETTNVNVQLLGIDGDRYRGQRVQVRGELSQDSASGASKLVVKQYAMLHNQQSSQQTIDPNTDPPPQIGQPGAAPAGTAGSTGGGGGGGAAAGIGGISKGMMAGILIASGGGLAASIGYISADSSPSISKP